LTFEELRFCQVGVVRWCLHGVHCEQIKAHSTLHP